MNIKKVTAVYFSPTGGTKVYVEAIAKGVDPGYQTLDLTDREVRKQQHCFGKDELVIIGVPVYYGRIPQLLDGLLDTLQGDETPAVLVASYGNREFEDALVELQDTCEEKGFVSVAAAACIAPHTFSHKVAAGRPNQQDLHAVEDFVAALKQRLEQDALTGKTLALPGNRPYKEFQPMPFVPTGDETCTRCGICEKACPTGAIAWEMPRATDAAKCIRCLACVAACPEHSRAIHSDKFPMMVAGLEEKLLQGEKPAEFFLP